MIFRSMHFLGGVCLLLATAQAASAQGSVPPSAGGGGQESEARRVVQAASPTYRIAVGDVVQITVYQEDDLMTTAKVGDGGVIVFPLLGSVRVGGMSVSDATRELTARLKDGYLVNPMVTVSLLEQTKAKFTILGCVANPGSFEVAANSSVSLMEAVGMAGGFTRIASPSKITVKRGSGEVVRVNGKDQASNRNQPAFRIRPGDVITVPESLF